MKILLLILTLAAGPTVLRAQSTVTELNYGEVLQVDNIDVEFVKIISDSRCPKNVMCVRAGEAKVLVAIFRNGKFLKEQHLVFHASGVQKEKQNVLFSTEEIQLSGLALLPYPERPGSIQDEDYFLKVQIN